MTLIATTDNAKAVHYDSIGHLADSIGCITTAIRDVAMARPRGTARVPEPIQRARACVSASLASHDAGAALPAMTRNAVCDVTDVIEMLGSALERMAEGEPAGSRSVVSALLLADAQLTAALRRVPEADFKATIRALWGREEMPLRIR